LPHNCITLCDLKNNFLNWKPNLIVNLSPKPLSLSPNLRLNSDYFNPLLVFCKPSLTQLFLYNQLLKALRFEIVSVGIVEPIPTLPNTADWQIKSALTPRKIILRSTPSVYPPNPMHLATHPAHPGTIRSLTTPG